MFALWYNVYLISCVISGHLWCQFDPGWFGMVPGTQKMNYLFNCPGHFHFHVFFECACLYVRLAPGLLPPSACLHLSGMWLSHCLPKQVSPCFGNRVHFWLSWEPPPTRKVWSSSCSATSSRRRICANIILLANAKAEKGALSHTVHLSSTRYQTSQRRHCAKHSWLGNAANVLSGASLPMV